MTKYTQMTLVTLKFAWKKYNRASHELKIQLDSVCGENTVPGARGSVPSKPGICQYLAVWQLAGTSPFWISVFLSAHKIL